MKMLCCIKCRDVRRIQDHPTFCQCRQVWAVMVDAKAVETNHNGLILGLPDSTLAPAMESRLQRPKGTIWVRLFLIEECPAVRRTQKAEPELL